MLFLKLSVVIYLAFYCEMHVSLCCLQLKHHTQLVLQPNILSVTRGTLGKLSPETIFTHYTQSSMLSSFFTNKILHIATENFNKQQTHRPILPISDMIRLAYVIRKMANSYVCCD